jgi:hypothetical protein
VRLMKGLRYCIERRLAFSCPDCRRAWTLVSVAERQSTKPSNIPDHSILVVDRAVTPTPGCLVLAESGGEFVVNRFIPNVPIVLCGVVVAMAAHGQVIGWEAAQEEGLVVEYLGPHNEEWRSYWRLHCLQRLAVKDREKLFESDYASLATE